MELTPPVHIPEPMISTSIQDYAKLLMECASVLNRTIVGSFNNLVINVDDASTLQSVVSRYHHDLFVSDATKELK